MAEPQSAGRGFELLRISVVERHWCPNQNLRSRLFNLVVTAEDNGGNTAIEALALLIGDDNDNAPAFVGPPYAVAIPEGHIRLLLPIVTIRKV